MEDYFSDPVVITFLLKVKGWGTDHFFLFLLYTCIVLCKKVFMLVILGKYNGVVVILKL